MTMELNFFTRADIESTFRRIGQILGTGIFHPNSSGHPLVQSAFIELLIRARDLMAKTEQLASRITFDDDVIKTSQVKDVTDLITFVRDAACHPESDKHFLEPKNIKATFLVAYGKCNLAQFGELSLKSDYEDDVCFFYGPQRIYLHRHILRAVDEASGKLRPLLAENRPANSSLHRGASEGAPVNSSRWAGVPRERGHD